MVNIIKKKLNSDRGVTILLALLVLLVVSMVSVVIVTAATSSLKRVKETVNTEEEIAALESAAEVLKEKVNGAKYVYTYTYNARKTGREVVTDSGSMTLDTEFNTDIAYISKALYKSISNGFSLPEGELLTISVKNGSEDMMPPVKVSFETEEVSGSGASDSERNFICIMDLVTDDGTGASLKISFDVKMDLSTTQTTVQTGSGKRRETYIRYKNVYTYIWTFRGVE